MSRTRVVCVGGGLGAPLVMQGLRAHDCELTGLIAVTDSGRSTGKIRIALDVPAPGDIRNALTVLAEGDPTLVRLMNHRFATERSEDLDGMAFGNLLLAALTQQEGSFLRAVEEASRLLRLRGRVLPVTLYNTHLCAELADGTVVSGEVEVRRIGKPPIKRLFLSDDDVESAPGALEAIAAADLIVLGPGSLYTTICACLLVNHLAAEIARSDALVVYVANTTRHPGQTEGLGLADHVAEVVRYLRASVDGGSSLTQTRERGGEARSASLGGSGLDVALVNSDPPPADLRAHYERQGLAYLEATEAELARIRALGVEPVTAPLIDKWSAPRDLWQKFDTIRHHPERTAAALLELQEKRKVAPR